MATYNLAKRVILTGKFDTAQMQSALDVYMAFDRITAEQYSELSELLASKMQTN